MKHNGFLSFFKNKLNLFYVLAFAPLLPLMYYRYAYFNDPIGVAIPLYGFLILAMKKDTLSDLTLTKNHLQRTIGILIVFSSLFIYYAIDSFIPQAGFYGLLNYTLHLLGLLLIFFKIPALKQTFSAFFLILAAAFTGLTLRQIEHYTTPTVPYYVYLFSSVLGLFGLRNSRLSPTTIALNGPQGPLTVYFEAGCIGVYSLIIFSILIIITMVETSATKRTKLLWSLTGLIGVFLLNIIRLLIVVTTMYFYGWDFGQQVHQVIGYALFFSWLAIFLLLFSKRQTIAGNLRLLQGKLGISKN